MSMRSIGKRVVAVLVSSAWVLKCASAAPPPLLQWLNDHPRIQNAIQWSTQTQDQRFRDWPADKKAALVAAFESIWNWQNDGVPGDNPLQFNLVPENGLLSVSSHSDAEIWREGIYAQDAWQIFISHVAQTLAFEIGFGKRWSIQSFSDLGLEVLLNGKRMYYPSDAGKLYRMSANLTGYLTPTPATVSYRFLRTNKLIGNSPEETIHALLDWMRDHLEHFSGDQTYGNAKRIWQYPGWPPLYRVIQGTVSESQTDSGRGKFHYTAGCWGTVAFLISVLRTVNIPVELKEVCTASVHAGAHFIEQGLYLSHGDDPYNQITRKKPRFPIQRLLFKASEWEPWFREYPGDGSPGCEMAGKAPARIQGGSLNPQD